MILLDYWFDFTELRFLCTFVTTCLHYFSVALFVWVTIDSAHIYRMLSEVRDINHGRMTFYTAAGQCRRAYILSHLSKGRNGLKQKRVQLLISNTLFHALS